MLTVPEAARRTGVHPETIRRWIRSGRLRSHKVGTQHIVEEADLEVTRNEVEGAETLSLPRAWQTTADGRPMPDVARWVRRSQRGT